jgi:cytochrome c oxidase subunit 2
MIGKVRVLSAADYAAWEEETAAPTEISPEGGLQVYNKNACVTCHSLDGSVMTGPSFLGIWGKQEQMADGTTVTVDENYIRESILEPNAKIVAGFQPAMPTYQGLLDDDQIAAVIELIKSLGAE